VLACDVVCHEVGQHAAGRSSSCGSQAPLQSAHDNFCAAWQRALEAPSSVLSSALRREPASGQRLQDAGVAPVAAGM